MSAVVQDKELVASPTREITPARYEFIDALRGVAIFGVIAFHIGVSLSIKGYNMDAFHLGDIVGVGNDGVQLFYVVSAFSLMLSLGFRVGKKEPELFRHYLVRRFMRIAPMFYLAMILWFLYRAWNPFERGESQPSLAQFASAACFVNGWIPSHINAVLPGCWSVAIETNFYLLLPLAFAWIRSLRAAIITTIIVLVVGSGVSYLLPKCFPGVELKEFKFYWLPAQLCVFSLGLVLYFLFQKMRAAGAAPKSRATLLLLASAAVYILMAWLPGLPVRHFFVSLAFVMLALSLGMSANKLLVNRFWILLGQISFSAYLLHNMVVDGAMWALHHYGGPQSGPAAFAIMLPCVVLVTMALAWVTYRLIEIPGQALGKMIIRRMKPNPASA